MGRTGKPWVGDLGDKARDLGINGWANLIDERVGKGREEEEGETDFRHVFEISTYIAPFL